MEVFCRSSAVLKIEIIFFSLRTSISKKYLSLSSVADDEVKPFEQKEKVILIEKGHNHFEVLPEGWVQVTHNSGMHLYLHKTTRVCTLSKPYFLGPGSARVCILRFNFFILLRVTMERKRLICIKRLSSNSKNL